MFDIGSTEFLLIVIVAVIVIGPKDLPRALYKVGQVVGKARGMARHFRTGIDAMIREAELEELEKKWAAQNQRILEEHPATDLADSPAQEMTALPAPDLPAPDLPAADLSAAPEAGVEPVAASVPAAAPGAPKDGAPT